MIISLLKKYFGTANDRIIKRLYKEVKIINSLENNLLALTDQQLQAKTSQFQRQIASGISLDSIKHEAFALVREAAKRAIGQRHYDVQLIGGLLLHSGSITEMRTGEGKTLVATLPAYLNALGGKGVHIVTVNDYLAERDSELVGQVFRFLGLSVGCITSKTPDEKRKDAYMCDITYATNNELGFDYLRDNMKFTIESKVQRMFNFAIIDEVDSILIDEARTPLIISGPVDDTTELYAHINALMPALVKEDYDIDEKTRSITMTDDGITKIETLLKQTGLIAENSSLYDFENLSFVHYVNQALRAHKLFSKDVNYIVQNGKVMIIDEFTGRIMEGRRYSDGLHQAIEAKEKVQIQNENQTLASITFQNYFRMYPKLSGMTGTAATEAAELKDIYNLNVVSVPTHNKMIRIDHDDVIYGTKKEKDEAVLETIKSCYAKGQPVLVGTVSIEKSEDISAQLRKCNIPHNVLNAKMHDKEAQIIAQAGRFKAVTIATNMAGRGTDIMLGGNASMLISELSADLSMADKEQAIEMINLQIKQEKEQVIAAGGLYVIGTERHESRRIDNQLRGRSGRQGDPGETKFFLSLEDDLMRIFASDRIAGMLRTLGLKDGEAIHHPMINRSLEKAQNKVEAHNYEIRRNLLKFDDVMSQQRNIVYEQRNEIISAENISEFVDNMARVVCGNIVSRNIKPNSLREDWDCTELSQDLRRSLNLAFSAEEILAIDGHEAEIEQAIFAKFEQLYQAKIEKYSKQVMDNAARYILLSTLDQVWKDHLHVLDHLRQGISLRAYGQKDPLIEYKREAFALFEKMLQYLHDSFVQRICYLHIDTEHLDQQRMSLEAKEMQEMHTTRQDPAFAKYNAGSSLVTKAQPVKAYVAPELRDPQDPQSWGKIGRNDMCPCGSLKKYKHCHGAAL